MIPWTIKHKPKDRTEFCGNTDALSRLYDFVLNYKSQKKKAIIVHGPPGVGKTLSVELLSMENDIELVEVNASDKRDKNSINSVIGISSQYSSIWGKKKMILIDEIDGVSGMKDRGAVSAIVEIIKQSPIPIVLTANDVWNKKLSSLRYHCELLEFKKVPVWDVVKFLTKICEREKISVDKDILKIIATNNAGDLRSSLIDLYSLSSGRKSLGAEDLDDIGYREKSKQVFETLGSVLNKRDARKCIEDFDNLNMDADSFFLWLEENIPKTYTPYETSKAFDHLSRADIFRRRIQKRQYWRLMFYERMLFTAGVCLSKDKEKRGWTSFSPPYRLQKLFSSRIKRMRSKNLYSKIGEHTHTSISKAAKEYMSLLAYVSGDRKKFREFKKLLDLDDYESKLIKGRA